MAVPLDISSGHFTQFMTETLDKTNYQDPAKEWSLTTSLKVILSDPSNFPLPPDSVFPCYLFLNLIYSVSLRLKFRNFNLFNIVGCIEKCD